MSKLFIPIETAKISWEGSHPFSVQYQDIFYSLDNGIKQSRYVFIDGNNLIERWDKLGNDPEQNFSIGELGFGTGLNFLLSLILWEKYAPKSACLHYIACEKHPLTLKDLVQALKQWPELNEYSTALINQYPILTPGNHHLYFFNGKVKLTLMLGDCFACFEQLLFCGDSLMEDKLRTQFINAWFLDGFTPKKNESMWQQSLFQVLALLSQRGSTFATYTSSSLVKKALIECGFEVIKKKGYGIKRHMLHGYLNEKKRFHLKQKSTPWHVSASSTYKEKSALVVGAGLAGCFIAHCLAKKNWTVTLIEENDSVGQGASANHCAILFPKLSAFKSPLTEFMLEAFLFAHRFYNTLLKEHCIGTLEGILILPNDQKEQKAQLNLKDWLLAYPELGQLISADAASALSGVNISKDCLYIPHSGWMKSAALCKLLIQDERITLLNKLRVDSLVFCDNKWGVGAHRASVIILANGHKTPQFHETKHLPIKPIRGQMSAIMSTKESSSLKIPLCAQGHVVPSIAGEHHFGATYELGVSIAALKKEDNFQNLEKLIKIIPGLSWSQKITTSWAGVRASTSDYLPIVGPIAKPNEFLTTYAGFESNAKRWIAKEAPYQSGLYAFTGFGSRGLTTIPLAAHWLSDLINNELIGAPRHLLQALAPARFLRKQIIRD